MADRYVGVHQNPKGPGDDRPTAAQVIADEQLEGKWRGKVALITGCSSGIGIETARALAQTGATLYLTVCNLDKGKKALGDLYDSERVHLLKMDLESLDSVRSCAAEFSSKSQQLNTLILNAGVMATPEGRTKDGFETQFGTNHLAHFLFFNLLKDLLIKSSTSEHNSRVVILSSIAHRFGEVRFENLNLENGAYDPNIAYSQSKTANLWTANEIERRCGGQGLHAWSVQPGGIATNLMQHLSEEQVSGISKDEHLSKIFKSPEQGAATTVWAATAAALEGKGGKYLEDCQIIPAWEPSQGTWGPGYGPHAYDPEKEARLWDVSMKPTGLGNC